MILLFTLFNHPCSGILPVNAHAEVNMLNLNYIKIFTFYSSANRLSNDINYNLGSRHINSVEMPLKHGSREEIFRQFAEQRLYLHLFPTINNWGVYRYICFKALYFHNLSQLIIVLSAVVTANQKYQ